jgi:hypothetical protein
MTTYNVGQGIAQAIKDAGDEPRSNELTVDYDATTQRRIALVYGRDALYYYYSEDNRTNRLPFA